VTLHFSIIMKILSRQIFVFCVLFLTLQAQAQNRTYQAPKLSDPKSWTMVLLPDPQTYVKYSRNQPIFELMTGWVGENVDSLNIKLVLCTGDLVEQNNMPNPNGVAGNQSSTQQWEAVSRAFSRLDGKVAYVAATGNHDYGYKSAENRNTNFNQYFPAEKNFVSHKMLREIGADFSGAPTLANATYEMTTPHGKKLLVMVLEFAPAEATLAWAGKVVNQPKYKDHQVIILTHSYLNSKNEHIVKEGYSLTDANYGAAMWSKLIQPSKNIRFVFSGHIGAPNSAREHVGFRTDRNAGNQNVSQMVFNAQAMGGGWQGNGGDGWLRLLEFLPDGKTVKVKTFSPFFAISPTTWQFAWRTEVFDEFTFSID
jgi:predicted MPP superfamily phosphohydrolase